MSSVPVLSQENWGPLNKLEIPPNTIVIHIHRLAWVVGWQDREVMSNGRQMVTRIYLMGVIWTSSSAHKVTGEPLLETFVRDLNISEKMTLLHTHLQTFPVDWNLLGKDGFLSYYSFSH